MPAPVMPAVYPPVPPYVYPLSPRKPSGKKGLFSLIIRSS